MMIKIIAGRIIFVLAIGSMIFQSCNSILDPEKLEVSISSLETGSEASIRALHIVDENVIWAGGSGGQFLLTANGGELWKVGNIRGAENDDLRSLSAWSVSKAQFFGTSNPGRAYSTETAGEAWEVVYENSSEGIFFNSLNYANGFRGMALSDPIDSVSFLIRTSDGGNTWERVSGLPVLKEGEFNFAASNSCIQYNSSGNAWIVTGGGAARVISTSDHGDTWKASESGLVSAVPSTGIFSVSFIDDEKGIIVGGTFDNPVLNDRIAAFTLDGGEMWIPAEVMPKEYRSCVFWLKFKGKDVAVAVGKTGIDISTDNGNSWHNVSDDGYYTGRGVPDSNIGFLAGSDGRISKIELSIKGKRDKETDISIDEKVIGDENNE